MARKRLTYGPTEDEEESDDNHHKRSKLAKMKGIAETSENQFAVYLPRKRFSPEHMKASGQKITESRASRSQKNK
ncbi:unnamed protein product [Urochloa humidicola]